MTVKKILVSFLAFVLFFSNSGLAFNVHFCGSKIAGVSSVFDKEESCEMEKAVSQSCCAKKQKEHKKCCSDKEIKFDKKQDNFSPKSTDFAFVALLPEAIYRTQETIYTSQSVSQCTTSYYCDAHAPPLYTLYCQLVFYA